MLQGVGMGALIGSIVKRGKPATLIGGIILLFAAILAMIDSDSRIIMLGLAVLLPPISVIHQYSLLSAGTSPDWGVFWTGWLCALAQVGM